MEDCSSSESESESEESESEDESESEESESDQIEDNHEPELEDLLELSLELDDLELDLLDDLELDDLLEALLELGDLLIKSDSFEEEDRDLEIDRRPSFTSWVKRLLMRSVIFFISAGVSVLTSVKTAIMVPIR